MYAPTAKSFAARWDSGVSFIHARNSIIQSNEVWTHGEGYVLDALQLAVAKDTEVKLRVLTITIG